MAAQRRSSSRRRGRPREGEVGELGQRVAPPAGQCCCQALRSVDDAAGVESPPTTLDLVLELEEVDVAARHVEDVAVATAEQPVRTDDLAQLGDSLLQGVGGVVGQRVTPELLEDPMVRERRAGVNCEQREERALPGARHLDGGVALKDLDITEDRDAHGAAFPSTEGRQPTSTLTIDAAARPTRASTDDAQTVGREEPTTRQVLPGATRPVS